MKNLFRATALLILFAPFASFAADDKDHPELDKKTAEIMKKLGPLYKDAKSLRTDAVIETTITPEEGEKQVIKVKTAIEYQRPNMFAMRSKVEKDDKAGLEVVCDGKAMFVHARKLKQYTEGKAPKGMEKIGQSLLQLGTQSGMLFQNVLADDPAEALLDGVTKGEHAGMEKVDGKEAHHLKFEQEGLNWELWVAAEGQPWVLKASSTREGQGAKMVSVETYSNWKLNAEPTKDVFTFKAPEEAKKVKSIGRQKDDEGDGR
jgi:hypothetical protein